MPQFFHTALPQKDEQPRQATSARCKERTDGLFRVWRLQLCRVGWLVESLSKQEQQFYTKVVVFAQEVFERGVFDENLEDYRGIFQYDRPQVAIVLDAC